MAFRRDIIEAVFNEVQTTATDTYTVVQDDGTTSDLTIGDSDVDVMDPDDLEKRPAVFINFDRETPVVYNGVGGSPDEVVYDSNGNVLYVAWTEFIEMDTFITVRGNSRSQKEPIFEQVRRQLGRYDSGDLHETDLHEDINNLTIDTTVPADSTDLDDAVWGDQIQLYVEYARSYIIESSTDGTTTMKEAVDAVENISQINLEVDTDFDDTTTGFEYTIT